MTPSIVRSRKCCRTVSVASPLLLPVVILAAMLAAEGAVAGDETAPAPRRAPAPTPPPATEAGDMDVLRPGLAPLLREGSTVQQAIGRLHRHDETSTWRFTIYRDDPARPRHELIMLPNTHLGEMQQVVEAAGDRRVTFEVTGEVFIYNGRNYLLASFPPRIVAEEAATGGAAAEEADDELDQPATRSAREVMRELERASGPVTRRPEIRAARPRADDLLPENTAIIHRRGRVTRDSGGAWRFVFDADASGLADPPLTLLPCLLLQRIESHVRQAGSHVPILISGRVMLHESRNYLLPTAFLIPREQTLLAP